MHKAYRLYKLDGVSGSKSNARWIDDFSNENDMNDYIEKHGGVYSYDIILVKGKK